MSVMSKTRSCLVASFLASVLASGGLGGCGLFGSPGQSTVARGEYYASGNAYYDEFFVDLYLLQVGLAEAPKPPEAERQRLSQLLELEPSATPAMIELRLHEEALKLSHVGIHLRLDQRSVTGDPEVAATAISSNARPKDNPAAALLASVETSSTNLLRWLLTMKQKEESLSRLELMTIRLDSSVDRAFSQAPVGKLSEVKTNLADAHKLIPLMRARVAQVRSSTEQLLAALTHGINTDDGSIPAPIGAPQPKTEAARETGSAKDAAKKGAGKPHPKAKPPGATPAPAARPKPVADSDEPAKPRAPSSKPAPPPRDFEP